MSAFQRRCMYPPRAGTLEETCTYAGTPVRREKLIKILKREGRGVMKKEWKERKKERREEGKRRRSRPEGASKGVKKREKGTRARYKQQTYVILIKAP